MHTNLSELTYESIPSTIDRMRTTLDLPEGLVEEAKAMLGYKSKTDTIVFALEELIRRRKIGQLKNMFGTVQVEVDIAASRRRPGSRSPA